MKIKQAIQITHNNVKNIMELPCITGCEKGADGSFYYSFRWRWNYGEKHLSVCYASESEWVVELDNGNWTLFTNKEWKELEERRNNEKGHLGLELFKRVLAKIGKRDSYNSNEK